MPAKPRQPKDRKLQLVPKEVPPETVAMAETAKDEAVPEADESEGKAKAHQQGTEPLVETKRPKRSRKTATDDAPSVPDPVAAQRAQPTASPSFDAAQADVKTIPLDRIDLGDTTYRFRASLRVGPLKEQLAEQGLQIPIIVRRIEGTHRYQLISGFRRTTAATQLGWKEIPAIVRRDLDNDEVAFRASVAENTSRKTYSDIDRALVVRSYRQRGHGQEEVGRMLDLTERQVRNVETLLELPQVAQDAVDDPEKSFTATHALALRQLAAKHGDLDWAKWVQRVTEEGLSVAQLKREVNKEHGGRKSRGAFGVSMEPEKRVYSVSSAPSAGRTP